MKRAALVVLGLTALYLGLAVLGPETLYTADLRAFVGARDRLIVESWRHGEPIPGWVPGIFGGVPGLGTQEFGLLYPPNILLALAFGDRAVAIGLAVHFLLGGLGTLALARRLGASEAAALVAAAAFMFGGAVASAHMTPLLLAGAAWTTWAAWGLLSAVRGEKRGFFALVGSFLAIFLIGDPTGAPLAALVALTVSESPRRLGRGIVIVVVALLVGALLAAVQLLPAHAVLQETARRDGVAFGMATEWSFWPPEVAGVLVPFAFGNRGAPETVWLDVSPDHGRAWAEAYYVGPIVLALAAAGLARLWESALARAGLVVFLVFAPFALGKFTPLYGLAYHIPGVKFFRFPAKLMLFASLGPALLAASGLEGILRARGTAFVALGAFLVASLGGIAFLTQETRLTAKQIAALEGGLAHVAIFALGGLLLLVRPRRDVALAIAVLAALDVGTAVRPAFHLGPREPFDAAPRVAPVLEELSRREGAPARVVGFPSARAVTPEDVAVCSSPSFLDLAFHEALVPNNGLGRGVLQQDGFLGNQPSRFTTVKYFTHDHEKDDRVAALSPVDCAIRIGARYALVGREDLGDEGVPVRQLGTRSLVRLVRAPPWAAIYGRVRRIEPSRKARLEAGAAVGDPAFDPRHEAVIEAPEEPCDPRAIGTARLAGDFEPSRFALDVETSGPAWLVVREAWASGWSAEVDGKPVRIAPADVMFRAVPLPAGAKHVTFRFETPRAGLGALVSAATALLLAASLLAWSRLNRKTVRV